MDPKVSYLEYLSKVNQIRNVKRFIAYQNNKIDVFRKKWKNFP